MMTDPTPTPPDDPQIKFIDLASGDHQWIALCDRDGIGQVIASPDTPPAFVSRCLRELADHIDRHPESETRS